MLLRRLLIGVGGALAVIAPLVVAMFYSYAVADFVLYFDNAGWSTRPLPAITTTVIGSKGVIVAGLIALSVLALGVLVFVGLNHRGRLLGTAAGITICSLHVSLLATLLLLMCIWLPIVARV